MTLLHEPMVPKDLFYTLNHEWVRHNSNKTLTIGITEYAQKLLGDLVFIEIAKIGTKLTAGQSCAVIESVKSASDIHAPVAGKIIAINNQLSALPELVNQQPYGSGWLFKLKPNSLEYHKSLMDSGHYTLQLRNQ